LRAAIEAQINHIVYNLLSGCSGSVYESIMKPNVAAAMSGYVAAKQAQINGDAIVNSEDGNLISKPAVESNVSSSPTDSISTQNPDTVEPTTISYEVLVSRPGSDIVNNILIPAGTGAEAARIVEKELIEQGAKGSGYKIVVTNPQKNIVVFTLEDRGPLNTGKPNL
jgi:hypothetical protein